MKFSLPIIPPWVKWAGIALVLVSLLGLDWRANEWRHRAKDADTAEATLASYREQVEKRDLDHNTEASELRRRAETLATELAVIRSAYTELLRAIPQLPLTQTHEAPPNENGHCAVVTRSAAYRVCHNAAWTGDPAQLAACRAYGGDAAAGKPVPPASLVRPGER